MKLSLFNGGLNVRQAPHLVPPHEGVIYTNIDNSKGHFTPLKAKRDVTADYPAAAPNVEDFGFYFDVTGGAYFTEQPEDWVVYNSQLYHADRVGRPERLISGNDFAQLGLTPPVAAGVTLTGFGAVVPDEPLTYALTYYSSITGFESAPTVIGTIDRHADGVEIANMPPSLDPTVTHIRIYRLGGNITVFSRVIEVTDVTSTYGDDLDDDQIEGSVLTTEDYQPAPIGLKYLIEFNSMLFGALGNKVYFTPIGVPDAWPALYFLTAPNEVTGLGKTPIGLLIFTKNKTILVTGTGPTTLSQQGLTDDQGCIDHDTIVNLKGRAVWQSFDGICESDGGIPKLITMDKMGFLQLEPAIAVYFNETYYLHTTTPGKAFIIDFAFGCMQYIEVGDTTSFVKVNDELFALGEEKIWKMFNADTNLTADFKTGWIVDGGMNQMKNFDRYYIVYTGQVTFTLFLDSIPAYSKTFNSVDPITVEMIKLPSNLTRALVFSAQFTGTGQVFDFDLPVGSSNG